MCRQWMLLGIGLCLGFFPSPAAVIGVAGDSFDLANPAYASRLESSGHTFRTLNDFEAASLEGLDAVWIDGFTAFVVTSFDLASPSLASFVRGGGTLLVESPGFSAESVRDFPFAENLSMASSASEANIRIRMDDTYLADVTEEQLSGWTQAPTSGRFNAITGWTGLADNGVDGQWVTISREIDDGTAIFTFQDISRMMFEPKAPEAIALLNSIIPVPEPSTYALLGFGGAALAWTARRQRKTLTV